MAKLTHGLRTWLTLPRSVGQILLVVGVLVLVASSSAGIVSWVTAVVLGGGWFAARQLGQRLANSSDIAWLPLLLPVAFVAKMAGAIANYYITSSAVDGYRGGDAAVYYRVGVEIAPELWNLQWPDLQFGSLGTQTVTRITGVLYAATEMDAMGGYLVFSSLSFLGLILFYVAFRRSIAGGPLKLYFLGIFFLPSLLFWPSAIGKDALMTLCLGVVAFGASHLFSHRLESGLIVTTAGIAAAFTIRPHIAVIAVGAIAAGATASFSSREFRQRRYLHRGAVVVLASLALFLIMPLALSQLGADEGFVSFAEDVQRRTARGGSAIESTPILSIGSVPLGIVSVISRPFPHEALSAPQLLASLEGLFILAIGLRALPRMLRERSQFLSAPYLSFALAFTLGFVVAFSTVSNLGIIARQRAQVLPFLLAVIVCFTVSDDLDSASPTVQSALSRSRHGA